MTEEQEQKEGNFQGNPQKQLENYIIQELVEIHRLFEQVTEYMNLGKKEQKTITAFKSKTITLYSMLRPKIKKYSKDENKEHMIKKYDDRLQNPSKGFKNNEAVDLMVFLNEFIENDLPLTKTKFWK